MSSRFWLLAAGLQLLVFALRVLGIEAQTSVDEQTSQSMSR
jgi:hypothetical protein